MAHAELDQLAEHGFKFVTMMRTSLFHPLACNSAYNGPRPKTPLSGAWAQEKLCCVFSPRECCLPEPPVAVSRAPRLGPPTSPLIKTSFPSFRKIARLVTGPGRSARWRF